MEICRKGGSGGQDKATGKALTRFHRTNGNKDSEETIGNADSTAQHGQRTERKALRCAGGD